MGIGYEILLLPLAVVFFGGLITFGYFAGTCMPWREEWHVVAANVIGTSSLVFLIAFLVLKPGVEIFIFYYTGTFGLGWKDHIGTERRKLLRRWASRGPLHRPPGLKRLKQA